MTYEYKSFQKQVPLFAHRSDVVDFLESYSDEIRHLIQFNANVLDIVKKNGKWDITYEDLLQPESRIVETYDAVVVSTGYFYLPFIPEKPGLKEWSKKYPGTITHSKNYRNSVPFEQKVCYVIQAAMIFVL